MALYDNLMKLIPTPRLTVVVLILAMMVGIAHTQTTGRSSTGIFRPTSAIAILDVNGDGYVNYNFPGVDKIFSYPGASPSDKGVVGDWNGDGRLKIGVFRSDGWWFLDTNGDGVFDAGDSYFSYSSTLGDIPVVGDWNGDGRTKTGVFRPAPQLGTPALWILDVNGDGAINYNNLPPDMVFAYTASPGDIPVVGDWNGSGTTKTGLFRPAPQLGTPALWILDVNGDGTINYNNLPPDMVFAYTASPGDIPVVGDWNGSGTTKTGLFRPAPQLGTPALWILDVNGDGTINYNNLPPDMVFAYTASPGDIPVVGDWNGRGTTKTGIFRPAIQVGNAATWILDANGDGTINYANVGKDMVFAYTATPGDTPLVGKWLPLGPVVDTTAALNTCISSYSNLTCTLADGTYYVNNASSVYPPVEITRHNLNIYGWGATLLRDSAGLHGAPYTGPLMSVNITYPIGDTGPVNVFNFTFGNGSPPGATNFDLVVQSAFTGIYPTPGAPSTFGPFSFRLLSNKFWNTNGIAIYPNLSQGQRADDIRIDDNTFNQTTILIGGQGDGRNYANYNSCPVNSTFPNDSTVSFPRSIRIENNLFQDDVEGALAINGARYLSVIGNHFLNDASSPPRPAYGGLVFHGPVYLQRCCLQQ
jgi:hypothetical protein